MAKCGAQIYGPKWQRDLCVSSGKSKKKKKKKKQKQLLHFEVVKIFNRRFRLAFPWLLGFSPRENGKTSG